MLVDASILAELEALVPLAPLHQPHNVAAIKAVAKMAPVVPQVACFDTAFHRTLADEASVYPLPARWREQWGIRRFGFHGLSVEWCAGRAPEIVGGATQGSGFPVHQSAIPAATAATERLMTAIEELKARL